MKILICYATTEGQTRKIARHIADTAVDKGHAVELLPVPEATDIDLKRFNRVILAASVHIGHYQDSICRFAEARATELSDMPSLFLSVSLAAAGHEAEDWRALDHILEDFLTATGWTPEKTAQIAGAYLPSQLDILRRFVLGRIVAKKDPGHDVREDKEYTDWPALDALMDDWLAT